MNIKGLQIIGSEEWCSLDEFNIPAIKARVDSGAKTSSIQASNVRLIPKGNEEWVYFNIKPLQGNRNTTVACQAKLHDKRMVKSSTGLPVERFVIKTPVRIGALTFNIELTLANRDAMEFRMLLGREALEGRYLINPSACCLKGDISVQDLKSKYIPFTKKKSALKIALLASNPESYSNKRIIAAGRERGHNMQFLAIDHTYIKLHAGIPEIHHRGNDPLGEFDALIPRTKPAVTLYECALIRQFNARNIYTMNSAEAIRNSGDKLLTMQLLARYHIKIPATGFATPSITTRALMETVNAPPMIIRILERVQGKEFILAETLKTAESIIDGFKSIRINIMVQEFIKEANGFDIQCFIVDGKIIAAIQRQAIKENTISYGTRKKKISKIKITPEERRLAVKATKILHLTVAGVTLIRSDKGPLVLDVQASPDLEAIENATGKDIANIVINTMEKKLKYEID